MRKKTIMQLAGLALALVLLSGCTMMTITNTSDEDIHIMVSPPDSVSYSFYLMKAGQEKAIDSLFGGSFTIVSLPDLGILTALQDQKEKIEARIVVEDLSVEQVKNGQAEVLRLQNLINAEKLKAGANVSSCGGNVQDFGSVTSTVYIEPRSNAPAVTCKVENPKVEGNNWMWDIINALTGAGAQ